MTPITDMFFTNPFSVQGLNIMQPMLNRQERNKVLSPVETEILQQMYPPVYFADESEQTNSMLILKYFFDDYLSDRFQSEIDSAGHTFLDMGLEFQRMERAEVAYTDYCHLTPIANRFIAESIGKELLRTHFND